MAPENQIMDLLTRRRGRLLCADCIPLELHWPNPKAILGAMHAIGMAKGFHLATGACSRCGGSTRGSRRDDDVPCCPGVRRPNLAQRPDAAATKTHRRHQMT